MTGSFEGQKGILDKLLRQLHTLVLLLLKCFYQRRGKHQIFLDEERVGSAFVASSCRATNSVNVVFDLLRHVVIDDILDIVDVKTSTSNIRCNEHCACAAILEVLEQLFTHLLVFVTMDALHTFDALLVKLLDQVVYSFLSLTKYECAWLTAICLQLGQELDEAHVFVVRRHAKDLLFD